MVAVVEGGISPLEHRRTGPALHRLVAVAVRPAELRAGSDLVRRLAGVEHVDLLLVTDGDEAPTPWGDIDADDDEDDIPRSTIVARERAAQLGLALDVHRLGLPVPVDVRPRDVDDLVAAISELVGFDPEPGVGCVVPLSALRRAASGSPADAMVGRAVERVVAAYRLPLVTYVAGAG